MGRSRVLVFGIAAAVVLIALVGALLVIGGDDDDGDGNGNGNGDSNGSPVAGVTSTTDDGDGEGDDDEPTAESVLEDASAQWAETDSAHFVLSIDGEVFLDDERTLQLRAAEGDIQRPDSVKADADIVYGPVPFDVSLIGIGDEMYWTGVASGNWEEAPSDFGYNPAILFDDEEGIGGVLTGLESPTLEGTENVEGREAHKVTGTVTSEAIDSITAGAIEGENIPATIWIGTDTADILKVEIAQPDGGAGAAATWTLVVTNHNEPVEIEAPQLAS